MKALNVAYFTASTDPPDVNKKFSESLDLDYPILSDPDKSVGKAYGVLRPNGFANRWTFYIDKDGVIREIDKMVKPASSCEDVVAKLNALGIAK